MIHVTLKPVRMKLFQKNTAFRHPIPESWNEVPTPILQKLILALMAEEPRFTAVHIVMGKYAGQISAQDVYSIWQVMRFLHAPNPVTGLTRAFDQRLPGKELEGLTVGQFLESLNLEPEDIPTWLTGRKKVAQPVAISKYFYDSLAMIFHRCKVIAPDFFGSDSGLSANATAASLAPNFGWRGTFLQVAEGGAFGSFEELQKAKLHDVLTYLLQNWTHYKQQQEALKKSKEA